MQIPNRQKELDALTREYLTDPKPEPNGTTHPAAAISKDDAEIIEKVRAERNGKLDRLWRGDMSDKDNDHSAADDSFVAKLYPYTQDEEQIKRIHAASGLNRSKSETRSDYLQRSIDRARENTNWFYDWSRNGNSSPNPKSQDEVRSRSHSLGDTGMSERGNENLKHSIQAISFHGREKPGQREWIVHNSIWKGHASSWFGEGGVAKSLLALHKGLTVAADSRDYWMGFAVKTVPVLYADFELDADEQHRRALELCAGIGLDDVPEEFHYLNATGLPPVEAFGIAAEECQRLGAQLVIIDSVGFALQGDSEVAKDVLAFYRECVQPLKDAGATPHLIDHQAKVIKGEKYSDKQAFGSVYKSNAVRSSFQVRGSWEQNVVLATFTHKKNNFGWKEPDFTLKVVFEDGRISIERMEEAVPNPDVQPTAKEKVLKAIEELGRATAEDVQDKTGLDLGTVRNAITNLLGDGDIKDTGEKVKRSRIVVPSFTHSHTTKGTGTGTTADTPVSFDLRAGESATVAELKNRRNHQDGMIEGEL